ncbi:MAG: hypothetical protein CVT86_07040, partial [Alphaproteobacteria bacterium HGW-Alphaproteobacteria-8]
DLAPGAPAVLAPGGLHVMLMGLTAPLAAGDALPLTLIFEKAGSVTLSAPVIAVGAPAPMNHEHAAPTGHKHGG